MATTTGNFFDISKSHIDSPIISVQVISPDGGIVSLKMHKSQQMKDLIMIYSKRQCLHPLNLKFTYLNQLIKQHDSPESLNMTTSNKIYATLKDINE